ncbi:MAG: FecR domain-containing protein [Elusimicrobia bacterium]|nr:FecR domain-containing protein [Elusimicrobiota bacterium]
MMLLSFLLCVVTAASAQVPAAGLTRIGAAAAVKGAVMAQAPGAAVGRVLSSGKPVFLNDHVTTDAAGRLQVLLLDETVFTIGPNSDMVLDEFVYDPATSSGKVTARVTKGVFRFVTGKVARKDPASMKVTLPVGTIGIRGTIAGGQASPDGSTVILFGPGAQNNANENPGSVAVGNAGGDVVITQPGFGTTVLPGLPPASVTDMSGQAQQILGALGEAPQQGQSSGGTGASGSQAAGQDTAAGSGNAGTAGAVGDFTGGQNQNQTLASQTAAASGIADGLSTWDQVRSISPGQAYYFSGEAGPITCTGCVSAAPEASLQLQIDFSNRTVGGTGLFNPISSSNQSFIHIHGVNDSLNGDTVQQTISQIPFAALAGGASLVLKNSPSPNTNQMGLGSITSTIGSYSGSGFDGSAISLQNAGGVAAKNAATNLTFSAQNTLSATVTASGSFTAPR